MEEDEEKTTTTIASPEAKDVDRSVDSDDSRNVSSKPLKLYNQFFVIAVGNFVEWYDFAVIGNVAEQIGENFFPPADDKLSKGFLIFSVAFFVRPFGALLFGYIADTYGRVFSLKVSIGLMGAATLGLGICPTYSMVSYAAPIILITLRLMQGISVGGEGYTAAVHLYEKVEEDSRIWFLAMNQFSQMLGATIGNIVVYILLTTLSEEQMSSYGFRLPFILSVILIAIAFVMRTNLQDSEEFINRETKEIITNPIRETMTKHWKVLIAIVLMRCSDPMWTLTTWLPDYISESHQNGSKESNMAIVLALTISTILSIPFLLLSHKLPWENLMILFKLAAACIGCPLLFGLLNDYMTHWLILTAIVLPYIFFESIFYILLDAFCFTLLPFVGTRTTTITLAHNISAYVFGTLPLWSSMIVESGKPIWYVGIMLSSFAIFSVGVIFFVKSKRNSIINFD